VILADTSVWVDHLRAGNQYLAKYLYEDLLVMHPFVAAELAFGSLRSRNQVLHLLDLLPQAPVAQMSEVRHLIETRSLYAQGIGLIDAHLIASTLINPATRLWTNDKPLRKVADALGISFR
jgi:predicted nucleic acid-binding protein